LQVHYHQRKQARKDQGEGRQPLEKTEEGHLVKKQPVEGRQPLKNTEEGYLVKNNQEMKLDSGTP
jgi:hypothetical protein